MNTFLFVGILALRTLRANKLRSFLAMLGIIISVFSVTVFFAIGEGLKLYITQQFDELGSNNLIISASTIISDDGGFSGFENMATALAGSKLRLSHVRDLQKIRQFVDTVSPDNFQTETISYRNTREKATVIGVLEVAPEVYNLKIAKGSFFKKEAVTRQESVVVLGQTIADKVFGPIEPVGKKIRLGSRTYRVVGVLEKKGATLGNNLDEYVFMPLTSFFNLYDTQTVIEIFVKTNANQDIAEAKSEVEKVLGRTLKEDEFSVVDQNSILEATNSILNTLTLGVTAIAGISLVVGGIGIMNIMLVSVAERTKEIGLRKALGATPSVILLQFLIESAVLALLGGLLGLLLAFTATLAIQQFFPAQVTLLAVALALGVSATAGIVFGVGPARRASLLSPIEALTSE